MVEKSTVSYNEAKPLVAKFDFANIDEGGGSGIRPKHVRPGEYTAVIKDVKAGPSKKTKTPQWVFLITPDKYPGATYPYYIGLTTEQAWKMRVLLTALGINAPKSVKSIDASKLVGKKLGIILEDDEYEGKVKSVIDTLITVSDVTEDSTSPDADVDDDDDTGSTPADDDDDDELDLDEL